MLAIEITDLQKHYQDVKALRGIDLSVQEGDFFALLGPNGAGKSTTIGIISHLIHKTAGSVKIFEHDLDRQLADAKRHLGVVPQEFNLNPFQPTIQTSINQAGYYGIPRKLAYERAEEHLTRLGIWHKRNSKVRELSGGMKRRLMIANALLHEPKLLILDEPTAGVDVEVRHIMWDYLQELNRKGITIVLTTHYLEEAEAMCRNIAIIDKGNIVINSSMRELLKKMQDRQYKIAINEASIDLSALSQYHATSGDEHEIIVTLNEQQTLNQLFADIDRLNIEVENITNKKNRLETLFLNLTQQNNTVQGGDDELPN